MNAKETYRLKIEAEVKLANVKIVALKADSKNYKATALVKYTKHIDEVQHLSDAVTAKLTELGKASNDLWEKQKDGVERALRLLDVVVKGTADKFQKHTQNNQPKEADSMVSQEAYKLKIESKMEPIIARLTELKAEANKHISNATIKYSQPIAQLDEMHHDTMIKLTELGNVNQESWEGLEAGVEKALNVFNAAIKDVTEQFDIAHPKKEVTKK
jgi:hypothetical protein